MPFPGPWQKLRDIALADSAVSSETLYGTDVSPAELLKRFTHVTRVWVVSSSEVPEATYLGSPRRHHSTKRSSPWSGPCSRSAAGATATPS